MMPHLRLISHYSIVPQEESKLVKDVVLCFTFSRCCRQQKSLKYHLYEGKHKSEAHAELTLQENYKLGEAHINSAMLVSTFPFLS